MTDETPAGDPREPPSGAVPPWMQPPSSGAPPPPGDSQATRRGVRAAMTIAGAAVVPHLALLAYVKLSGNDENVWLFVPEGLLVIVVAFIAAIVVTLKLPLESRAPFWIAGIACMFGTFIVWGVTCGLGM
jgi:hypothetical protein